MPRRSERLPAKGNPHRQDPVSVPIEERRLTPPEIPIKIQKTPELGPSSKGDISITWPDTTTQSGEAASTTIEQGFRLPQLDDPSTFRATPPLEGGLFSSVPRSVNLFGTSRRTVATPPQPEKPVRPVDNGKTQPSCKKPIEKQDRQQLKANQLLSPPSTPSHSGRVAPSTSSKKSSSKENRSSEKECRSVIATTPSQGDEHTYLENTPESTSSSGNGAVSWEWTSIDRRKTTTQAFPWIVANLYLTLRKDEQLDGFIYAFKATNSKGRGYVKIGFVKDSVKKRIREHGKCYGECEQIYPPPKVESLSCYHAKRVERLIHAELSEHTMWLADCPHRVSKHTSHGEWFDVEEQYAIAVIRKWVEWIKTEPYEITPVDDVVAAGTKTYRDKPSRKGKEREMEEKKETKTSRKSVQNKKAMAPEIYTGDMLRASDRQWRLKDLKFEVLWEICRPLEPQKALLMS